MFGSRIEAEEVKIATVDIAGIIRKSYMNCILDDIESINVKFLRYCNGVLVMQEKALVPRRCRLRYEGVKCHDVCNLLSNDSVKTYIGRYIPHKKKAKCGKM